MERLHPGRVLAYGLFPPLFVVGPIASYDETAKTLDHRVPVDQQRAVSGVSAILTGLFKVFVIAFLLDWSADVFAVFADNPPWRIWVALIAFGWFFYANFAGYSDIAIGSSTLLGGDMRPNFDRPYQQTDPSAFWNSWHISLTRFMRTNVFTPIAAGHPERQYLATFVTMMLIALWHGVSWATFVFGLYHAASLIGHRMLEARRPPSTAPTGSDRQGGRRVLLVRAQPAVASTRPRRRDRLLPCDGGAVIDWSTRRAVRAVSARFGVLRSWGSLGRVAIWVVVWCVIASVVVAPHLPRYEDREHQADQPPSGVRYVGPISRTDYAGFLPPEHDPESFTVAWVGGSEVKLREISIPGAFDQRVDTVGGRPIEIDSYNVIAPRIIDAIRAIDTAEGAGADAIVVALNPAWVRTEWSLRGWPNLDVSNLGALWSQPSSWSWALGAHRPRRLRLAHEPGRVPARRGPDTPQRVRPRQGRPRSTCSSVRNQALKQVDAGDPRLPPGSDMWLVDEYGPDVLADEDTRVASLIAGIGVPQDEARYFASLLLDEVEERGRAGVPVRHPVLAREPGESRSSTPAPVRSRTTGRASSTRSTATWSSSSRAR